LTQALQDETSLKEMILSPESLLNNLLDGIEEAAVEDEESEDEILKNSDEKQLKKKSKKVSETFHKGCSDFSRVKKFKVSTIEQHSETVLLHKRPYEFKRSEHGNIHD
jgi:hypothetical protein